MRGMLRGALAGAILLAAAPASPWWWEGGAQILKTSQADYDAGRYEAVISRLDPAGLQSMRGQNLCRGYLLLGASYERVGRPDKALGVYQVGVRLFRGDQETLARLAELMHRSGLDEQAQPLYESILKVNPGNPRAHLGLAEIDRALGFSDRGAEHYKKALEGFKDRPEVWRDYARLLYEARDFKAAEPAARRALSLESSDSSTMVLALILREEGRAEEAAALLEPLARGGSAGAQRARALWLLEAGLDSQARAAAGALDSQDPLALYVRARLALKAGRKAEALERLRAISRQAASAPFAARVSSEMITLLSAP